MSQFTHTNINTSLSKKNNCDIAVSFAAALCFTALNQNAEGGYEFQLLPAGEFAARDGRPANLKGVDAKTWKIDAALAANIIKKINARQTECVVDYEHQTLLAKQNGKPAPSSGWFSQVEWREGEGLFAVDVRWTDAALSYIKANEYKYISPVISFDKKTGAVLSVEMAALTNNPALDGMAQVALSEALNHAIEEFYTHPQPVPATQTTQSLSQIENGESSMSTLKEDLLKQLRWMLNLPTASSEQDIEAELNKCIDIIKTKDTAASTATSFDLAAFLSSVEEKTATTATTAASTATSQNETNEIQTLREQIAQLNTKLQESEIDKVIQAALSSNQLLPAQEPWARELAKRDLALLTQYCENVAAVSLNAAFNGAHPTASLGAQTGGTAPAGASLNAQPVGAALTQEEKDICSQLGVSEADYIKNKTAQ